MSKLVAITIDGETQIHAANTTGLNYASLCGLDGGRDGDTSAGQSPARLPKGAKIDCPLCVELWKAWRAFRPEDFVR